MAISAAATIFLFLQYICRGKYENLPLPVKGVRTFGSHRSPRTQTKKPLAKASGFSFGRGGWILLRVERYAGLCPSGKARQRRPNLWFSSLTPYANKKTTCKSKWLFVWQGRLDSNQRNDGVRVRSLTAWRRPYFQSLYILSNLFAFFKRFYTLFLKIPLFFVLIPLCRHFLLPFTRFSSRFLFFPVFLFCFRFAKKTLKKFKKLLYFI